MPVANEGENQDEDGNHNQAGGLESFNLRRAVMIFRCALGLRCRHENILVIGGKEINQNSK